MKALGGGCVGAAAVPVFEIVRGPVVSLYESGFFGPVVLLLAAGGTVVTGLGLSRRSYDTYDWRYGRAFSAARWVGGAMAVAAVLWAVLVIVQKITESLSAPGGLGFPLLVVIALIFFAMSASSESEASRR